MVFGVLGMALVLFAWGRWRYDIVALMALIALAVAGVIPGADVFTGFSHPAVITVASVLVLSRGLMNSGAVDLLAKGLAKVGERPTAQVGAMSGVVALCSGFMNNIGALALLLPVALRLARNAKRSPSYLLMPLAFASLLGGLTTLVGSPPNIVVATFRADITGEPFRMFDFAPVGVGVAFVGVLFISLVGWRLIPKRDGHASREELFRIEEYTAEARVPEDSKLVGKRLRDIGEVTDVEAIVVGIVRAEKRVTAPSAYEFIRADDVLVIEAEPEALQSLVEAAGLELVGNEERPGEEALRSDEVAVYEAVVMPDSPLTNRSLRAVNARWRFGVNVLAVARQGARLRRRLAETVLRAGDILLIQTRADNAQEALRSMGCLPLAERGLRPTQPKRIATGVGIFAVALACSAIGLLPVQIALSAGALGMVLSGLVSLRDAYDSVEWPIIVLLGAMIPVGVAMETTGGAQRVADLMLALSGQAPVIVTLALLLIVTLLLSDIINNAAVAVLMAPVGVQIAHALDASPDPFLMIIVLGSAAAFLTPIGHQSNTLVMGPGGYRFGDYWRMGLPLSVIYVLVGVPLVMLFWPLYSGGS
ncbi:MAG: SLC13 family permease [Phycisphaerales bacterium]|nr:MAG: SLC13 family permease [Phycisphaerales bacterium]